LNIDIVISAPPAFSLQRSKTIRKAKTMFAKLMSAFDRFALPYFLALAITPMLAVAAAASIH
jgi:hypothetical protein